MAIIWLLPYILVGAIIAILFKLCTPYILKNKTSHLPYQKNTIKDTTVTTVTTYFPQNYPKDFSQIRKEQNQRIKAFTAFLETSDFPNKLKIINRLCSFRIDYWQKGHAHKSYLYDYILQAANERISTTKRKYVKTDCEAIIKIVHSLQKGMDFTKILQAISSDMKETKTQATAKLVITNPTTNHILKPKEKAIEVTTPKTLWMT